MKTKVVLSEKAQKVSSIFAVAAIAGVIGLGGLTLTNGQVSAVTQNQQNSSQKDSGSGSSTKKTTTTTPKQSTTGNSGSTTTTTPEPEPAASTPNTGLFTGDGEFTREDGIILLTGGLATVLAGYVVYRNRKSIFHGRVKFSKR